MQLLPRQRYLLYSLAATGVVIGALWLITWEPQETYSQTAARAVEAGFPPVSFSFDYPRRKFERRDPGPAARPRSGRAYVTLDRRADDGTLIERFQVGPFQPGRAAARAPRTELPILAIPVMERTARAYRGYQLKLEGGTTAAGLSAYQFFFDARQRVGGPFPQKLYGRVLIVSRPPLNQGVAITELATGRTGLDKATDLALDDTLENTLQSFQFGTG